MTATGTCGVVQAGDTVVAEGSRQVPAVAHRSVGVGCSVGCRSALVAIWGKGGRCGSLSRTAALLAQRPTVGRSAHAGFGAGGSEQAYWALSSWPRTYSGVGVSRRGGAVYLRSGTHDLQPIAAYVADVASSSALAAVMGTTS